MDKCGSAMHHDRTVGLGWGAVHATSLLCSQLGAVHCCALVPRNMGRVRGDFAHASPETTNVDNLAHRYWTGGTPSADAELESSALSGSSRPLRSLRLSRRQTTIRTGFVGGRKQAGFVRAKRPAGFVANHPSLLCSLQHFICDGSHNHDVISSEAASWPVQVWNWKLAQGVADGIYFLMMSLNSSQ